MTDLPNWEFFFGGGIACKYFDLHLNFIYILIFMRKGKIYVRLKYSMNAKVIDFYKFHSTNFYGYILNLRLAHV